MKVLTSISLLLSLAACSTSPNLTKSTASESEAVSIFIVRHGETDQSQPATLPLSNAGTQLAEVLAATMRDVPLTHLISSHTTRSRQMLDRMASSRGLPIAMLPAPGSLYQGERVTDQTTRRAPIEPVSQALLSLPPGSVAVAALNSENIYAVLNRLGIPVARQGEQCMPKAWCLPCTDNGCYPRDQFDHLWHIVLDKSGGKPISFTQLRYGASK